MVYMHDLTLKMEWLIFSLVNQSYMPNLQPLYLSAIKSVEQFHEIEMYQHEFTMVTKHFKYADEETKNTISSLIIRGEPGPNVRINHACLIGYDFKGFTDLPYSEPQGALLKEFLDRFYTDGKRLTGLLQKKFDDFDKKHLCFDVFFIPFPSVSEFRNAFNAALD